MAARLTASAATDTRRAVPWPKLRAQGLAAPEDVKLVGFDDLPIARQTIPPLTTVRQDIAAGRARAGRSAAAARLGGETTESLVLPPELVLRETA